MRHGWLGWVAVVAALAACGGPAPGAPQAQFASADDAAGDAVVTDPDADAVTATDAAQADVAAGDVPADDVQVDVPVTDVALADVPAIPDALPPADAVIGPPDVAAVDVAPPPDVILSLDGIFSFDLATQPDSVVGPVCGDGMCQPPSETSANCPTDCGVVAWSDCAANACASAWNACQNSGGCSGAVDCAQNCQNVSCVQACTTDLGYNTLLNTLEPFVTCARAHNCLSAPDPGPGGGPSTCGNGKCDGGETHLTCPKDCPFPITASEQCQVQNCGDSYSACAADLGCVTAATCYNQGNSGMCFAGGVGGQLLSDLVGCIQQQCP